MGSDGWGQLRISTDRRAKHDAIRALHRPCGVDLRTVRDAELHNPVERLAGARVGDDLAREVAAFHRDPRDRAPDQTDADQRQAFGRAAQA